MGNTCKTCINNDDGLCDRKGDSCRRRRFLRASLGSRKEAAGCLFACNFSYSVHNAGHIFIIISKEGELE